MRKYRFINKNYIENKLVFLNDIKIPLKTNEHTYYYNEQLKTIKALDITILKEGWYKKTVSLLPIDSQIFELDGLNCYATIDRTNCLMEINLNSSLVGEFSITSLLFIN